MNNQDPDPCVCKYLRKMPASMWAIINTEGFLLTETVTEKRWKSIYAITHGSHKWPQSWESVYYRRGFRCIKVFVMKANPSHTFAAPSMNFDCDNKICLDYKSTCGGCIPEKCNYQQSSEKQKERDHHTEILNDDRERLIKIVMDSTGSWYHLTFDQLEKYRKGLEESLRGDQ